MRIIPKTISDDEACVRCITHPFMVRKGNLRKEALMPPPTKRKVSLLRLEYTDKDFCISHGKKLQNSNVTFVGLATLTQNDVKEVNDITKEEHITNNNGSELVQSEILYAPMNGKDYVYDRDVYIHDPDISLPMHADLTYNQVHIKEGTVHTEIQQYAKKLVKKMKFIHREENDGQYIAGPSTLD